MKMIGLAALLALSNSATAAELTPLENGLVGCMYYIASDTTRRIGRYDAAIIGKDTLHSCVSQYGLLLKAEGESKTRAALWFGLGVVDYAHVHGVDGFR